MYVASKLVGPVVVLGGSTQSYPSSSSPVTTGTSAATGATSAFQQVTVSQAPGAPPWS